MTLSALIQKGWVKKVATAISATAATKEGKKSVTTAKVATVAAAIPRNPGMFDRETFEERAAIMEYDGGLTRVEAERLATLIPVKTCEGWLVETAPRGGTIWRKLDGSCKIYIPRAEVFGLGQTRRCCSR